jgi:hypothetical protein
MSEPTAPDQPIQPSTPPDNGDDGDQDNDTESREGPSSHDTAGQFPADDIAATHGQHGEPQSSE